MSLQEKCKISLSRQDTLRSDEHRLWVTQMLKLGVVLMVKKRKTKAWWQINTLWADQAMLWLDKSVLPLPLGVSGSSAGRALIAVA